MDSNAQVHSTVASATTLLLYYTPLPTQCGNSLLGETLKGLAASKRSVTLTTQYHFLPTTHNVVNPY